VEQRRMLFARSAYSGLMRMPLAVTAAAIVIFWPAAFFVGGDKQTAELG
jgi:hypothetical protein